MQKKYKSKDKYLIVTADDFGANSNINKAVALAAKKGFLTSTNLMATSPKESLEKAIAIVKETPELDVGIHITLTSDKVFKHRPLSAKMHKKGLTNEGYFLNIRSFFKWNFLYQIKSNLGAVESEMRAQIEKLLEYGVKPSYICSHCYVTKLPLIKEKEIKLAKEYDIQAIRKPCENLVVRGLANYTLKKLVPRYSIKFIINFLTRINNVCVNSGCVNTPDHYYGILYSGNWSKDVLFHFLREMPSGVSEIVFHPSIINSKYYNEKGELELLLNTECKKKILGENIKLTNYKIFKR